MIVLDTSALVEFLVGSDAIAETLGVALVTVDRKFDGVPGLGCAVRNLRDGS